MKAVLYSYDLEPITVIDLHPDAWKRLENGSCWAIAVCNPVRACVSPEDLIRSNVEIVKIRGERIRMGQHESLMLFPHDEEASLLLRSALLPGQRKDNRSDGRELV